MDRRLSRRLGPAAKKLYLTAPRNQKVSALVTLAPSLQPQTFEQDVARCQGALRAWMPEARIASVDIDAGGLEALADLEGVVYVEVGPAYGP